MLFSTPIFLFFFLPAVIVLYYLMKKNMRVYFLMLASLFFYAWGEKAYVLVMLLSILINYVFGMLISYTATDRKPLRKLWLALAVAGNIGILYYFKYLDFTVYTINNSFHTEIPYQYVLLPVGISFFTFQGMSYIIDLYYQKVNVQKNPALVAFYISFFPQLMAGPIVRYNHIVSQIYKREESLEKFAAGAKRFILGLAKKAIIANTLGFAADQIFAHPPIENAPSAIWLGVICYTFQIYFDFSGYSDMAIGLAKMFGFDFLENFNYPYISKTITEFWRRWHISLSSWFRDYLYIPLGGNRTRRVYFNLIFVFIVTGFWHGANFKFLVWGLWHGLFLIIERLLGLREVKNKALVPLRYAATMLIVIIGWVFFRADGLPEAASYLGIMFGFVQPQNVSFSAMFYLTNRVLITLIVAAFASTPVFKAKSLAVFGETPGLKAITSIIYLVLFVFCIAFVVADSYNPFIYFRF